MDSDLVLYPFPFSDLFYEFHLYLVVILGLIDPFASKYGSH